MGKFKLAPRHRVDTRLRALPRKECSYYGTGFCPSCRVEKGEKCAFFGRWVVVIDPELDKAYQQWGE